MKKFGKFVCRYKVVIMIVSLLLIIPALIGMEKTKINYDILVYLPEDIETMKGQNILTEDFNMGAFSTVVADGKDAKEILMFESAVKEIDGVEKVVSIADITGTMIPFDFLPQELLQKVKNKDSTLILVTFTESISHQKTLDAVEEIRTIAKDSFQIGGMSSMVLDTMELSEQEVIAYIIIAVIFCLVVLMLSLDSYLVPLILLANIGIAILFNMGTNIIFGNISYITKAISAVLQLGVTTDFSIFLYHKYMEFKGKSKTNDEAMEKAISDTILSVFGSSLTTVAGFLALCTMSLTLGKDIGLVMAKGVIFGVICVITVFPSFLLILDKYIEKTKHRVLLPKFKGINHFVMKHHKAIFVIFLLLIVPFWYGNQHTPVYYNLDRSLPSNLPSSIANNTLKEKFNIVSPQIILVDKDLKSNALQKMVDEVSEIEGIDLVLSSESLEELGIPISFLNEDTKKLFESNQYQLILINSIYNIATDELNEQIELLDQTVKKYDQSAIVAGEGPLMKDLVETSDLDFKNVSFSSILLVFIIMILVLRSLSLPILLVLAIEFAIFVNMGIPYYFNTTLPFVSSIVIGTIQLGATIDYAILMTTKYLEERKSGKSSKESMEQSLHSSVASILVSGMCLFAATFGVGVYSKLEMISSICNLIARGAIVSMIVVILVIPSLLLLFDKIICKTTTGFGKEVNMKSKVKKLATFLLIGTILGSNIITANATVKNETVYAKLKKDGTVHQILVNEHIYSEEKTIKDLTDLKNIMNINGEETYQMNGNQVTWDGNNIFYQGQSEKELPIGVQVSYRLDGTEITKEELLGKKGKVEITLSYINKDKHTVTVNGKKEEMYTPFLVTVGMIIPNKNNNNLEVTNGKVVNNGVNNFVIAMSTPGLSDSLKIDALKNMNEIKITYDTTSFKDSSIYSVVTPKIISSEDLKIFDKMDSLYTSIYTLSNSSKRLLEGSKKVKEGMDLYNSKIVELVDSLGKLKEGSSSLTAGYEQIHNGITSFANGVSKLESLLSNVGLLGEKVNEVAKAFEQLSQNSNQLTASIDATTKGLEHHIEVLMDLANRTTDEETKIQLQQEILALQKSLEQSGLNNLTTNIAQLNNGIAMINQNLQKIVESSKTMLPTINGISSNMEALKEGSNLFYGNLKQFDSMFQLLWQSSSLLKEKTNELKNGVDTLYQGMNEFNSKGIQTLNYYVNGNIKGLQTRLESLIKLGEEYQTFTMKDENTLGETKFIMMIE